MSEQKLNQGSIEIPLQSGARLRQTELSDAPLLFERLRANKKRLRKAGMHVPRSLQEVEERIQRFRSAGRLDLGIWAGNELAGEIGLGTHPQDPLAAEIFYWVDRDHIGQGHASSAVRNLSDYALDSRGFHLLTASVNSGNFASQRTLESAGFQLIGDDPVIKTVYFRRARTPTDTNRPAPQPF